MEYRKLGRSGLKISGLGLGSWVTFGKQVDQRLARELMARAYDAGINFFDNAEAYEAGVSERLMGEALKKLGYGRDTFIVSSKVFWGGERPTQLGLSRKHVVDCCHAALRRLQVEYLDLYYCHRPDPDTPIDETVWTMNTLINQGKILYWGTSEWSAEDILAAHNFARDNHLIGPVMEQPEYNLLKRARVEQEYAPLYKAFRLGLTVYSPLASGILTGKYNNGIPEGSRLGLPEYQWLRELLLDSEQGPGKLERVKQLGALAQELGVSQASLALAWTLKNPNVSCALIGCSRLSQLEANLDALHTVKKLTPDVIARINAICP